MVHVRINLDQGSLWSSEASLVTILDLLRIGIIDCKSQHDLVYCSLGIVSPPAFTFKRVVLLVFLSHHIFCYLLFRCVYYMR